MASTASQALKPIWQPVPDLPDLGPLRQDTSADVCVVGAGIAGLTPAYLLGKAGRNVVVLDAGTPGEGETGRTTAHLASALDDRFTELEKLFGEDGARLAYDSHAAAIDRVDAICLDENIDCDFTRLDGYLFAPTPDLSKQL